MDPDEHEKEGHGSSYPDPSSHNAGVHPFYADQQTRDVHISQAPTAPMHGSANDPKGYPQEYMRGPYSQPSTPQQLAQQGLNVNQSHGPGADDSVKKKQKVSRACDECRRKKIKCDAESEDPGVKCSACARSDAICQFSRQPQKRGPSKGYIKELAERVVSLERASGAVPYTPSAHGLQNDFNSYSPSPDFLGPESRKRSHSMIDGSQGLGSGVEQLQNFAKGYTPNMSSTQPDGGFYRGNFDPSQGMSGDLSSLGGEPIDDYYREMHTYLPILCNSRDQTQLMLSRARAPLRDAVLQTVSAAMTASSAILDSRYLDGLATQLTKLQVEQTKSRNAHENIIFLRALLFMIIAQENSGPGRNDPVLWYGVAFGIATYLKLHHNQEVAPDDSPEAIEIKTDGRRAYLMLVMLDRWHSAGMVVPLNVADEQVSLLPSDLKLLGDSAYNLIRLSLSLGHISETLVLNQGQTGVDRTGMLLGRALRGELQRFREGTEQQFSTLRHVHLAYLAVKLLSDRHLETNVSNTKAILSGAFKIISLLASDQNRASPLTHHFAALATITLAEVLERDPQPIGDALKLLQSNLENGQIQYPYGVAHTTRPAWSTAISAFISKKAEAGGSSTVLDRGGLQHLADAAAGIDDDDAGVAGSGGGHAGEDVGRKLEGQPIDWTKMTIEGYLRLFE